jgi:hypothetical protein
MQFKLDSDSEKFKFKTYVNKIYKLYENTEKYFYLDVKELSELRSLNQNSYYWGVVIEICQEIIKETEGRLLSPELVHENLKFNFGTQVFEEQKYYPFIYNGKVISHEEFENLEYLERNKCIRNFIMPSTAKMNKKQFNEYIKLIKEWAEFLSYEIPDPL